MLSKAMVNMFDRPMRKYAAQVITSELLMAMTIRGSPVPSASKRTVGSVANLSRTLLTLSAPSSAPTPVTPSSRP